MKEDPPINEGIDETGSSSSNSTPKFERESNHRRSNSSSSGRTGNGVGLTRHSSIPMNASNSSGGRERDSNRNNWGSRSYDVSDVYRPSSASSNPTPSRERERDRDLPTSSRDRLPSLNTSRFPTSNSNAIGRSPVQRSWGTGANQIGGVRSGSGWNGRTNSWSSGAAVEGEWGGRDRDRERERERDRDRERERERERERDRDRDRERERERDRDRTGDRRGEGSSRRRSEE